MIDGFAFEHESRTYTCTVETSSGARSAPWWWFKVSSEKHARYAPFNAAAADTTLGVQARIVAYYEALLAQRAAPPVSYWRRGKPQAPAADATAPAGEPALAEVLTA